MLRAILAQTFTDFELLVREDGSDGEETARVVARFDDSRLRFDRSDVRLGIPGVVNALIDQSVGELVLVLHDHDVCQPRYVEALVGALDAHPSALYAHGGGEIVDAQRAVCVCLRRPFAALTSGRSFLDLLLGQMECPVSACALVRRSAYERHGLLDPEYGFVADVELWMRLAAAGDVAYVPEVLISYAQRESGHEYHGVNWPLAEALAAIHWRYGRQYRRWGLAWLRRWWAVEQYLVSCYLTTVDDPNAEQRERDRARAVLSRVGGLASLLLSHIPPSLVARRRRRGFDRPSRSDPTHGHTPCARRHSRAAAPTGAGSAPDP